MRRARVIVGLVAAAFVLSAQNLDVELQRTIQRATVNGDLKAAIEEYRKIVARAGSDRKVAAKALLQMAEAYQKLGDSEARKIYERVVREYAEQKEAVDMARARLGRTESAARTKGDRPVWTGPEVDIFGRISPDGRYLTYVDWFQTGNLMVHDMVTGSDHPLTKNKSWTDRSGGANWSSISRDGKQVVYEWWEMNGPDNHLVVANFHGTSISEPRRLLLSKEISSIRPFEWSPDGKWIAVHVTRADRSSQIGLVAVPDGSLRIMRTVDWRGPSHMSFSSDGKFLAYDLREGDNTTKRDVFVLAVDGSHGSSLVASAADDVLVGFSGDGRLLFASNRTGSMALWAQQFTDGKVLGTPAKIKSDFGSPWIQGMTASGALYITKVVSDSDLFIAPVDLDAGKLLAAPAGAQRFPSRGRPDWSQDSKFLGYIDCGTFGGGPCTISIRNMETGEVREIRPLMHYVAFPRWSPDGRLFVTNGRDLKGRRGVHLIDAHSGEATLVTETPLRVAGWSADGQKILLTGSGKLWERDLAKGSEKAIAQVPKGCDGMTVSPNGQLAACIDSEHSALVAIPTTGGEARELFRAKPPESLVDNAVLSWTRNSSALVVTKRLTAGPEHLGGTRELWVVPVSGTPPRKLNIDANGWDILNSIGARVSPDGRHIAFMAGEKAMEVWALEGFLPAKNSGK